MINTINTRYEYKLWSPDVWALNGWYDFLETAKLRNMDDFMSLQGEIVDKNRRSQVHKIDLGSSSRTFFLKKHENYVKRTWKTFFRSVPMIKWELKNLMCYARAGFDALEPVACGWRSKKGGGDSFMLLAELEGYKSLQDWLSDPDVLDDPIMVRSLSNAVAGMLHRIHKAGLAHVDLFSKHVFLKHHGNKFLAQPLDLERTKVKGNLPWSSWHIRRKQVFDLAALHLTVPWPQVGYTKRLRSFLEYLGHSNLSQDDKLLLRKALKIAADKGQHPKFKSYGVADRLIGCYGPLS